MGKSEKSIGIWVGQPFHFISLALLLILVFFGWRRLGQPYPAAFWIAIAIPIVHQIFVWLAWRLELNYQSTSRTIGFNGYIVLFFLFFGGRFVSLFVLGSLDADSLNLSVTPRIILTLILILPGVYAMFSVMKYFGMARAAGADHFDPKYRSMPLVNEGIFRFTNNGMYLYAFLLFWAFGVGFNSSATLLVAAFSHIFIWVHFYATEQPDMAYLYG